MGSQTKAEAEESIRQLGTCPLCESASIEVRWDDAADLVGYCRDCQEYFEV